MDTPQLLLLLLCGLVTAAPPPSAALQKQLCGGPAFNESAVLAPQWPAVLCVTATQSRVLTLPVLLTLNITTLQNKNKEQKKSPFTTPNMPNKMEPPQTVTQSPAVWNMNLELLDEAGRKVGKVVLNTEGDEVTLSGLTCDAMNDHGFIPLAALMARQHLQLGVAADEGKLNLTHMMERKNKTLLSLTFSGGLPSTVRATSATGYCYSALTTTTATTTTITTTTTAITNTAASTENNAGNGISPLTRRCVLGAVAAMLVVAAGLVLYKYRPHGLPTTTTTTTIPNMAWPPPEATLSRHVSENSLYSVVQLPQS